MDMINNEPVIADNELLAMVEKELQSIRSALQKRISVPSYMQVVASEGSIFAEVMISYAWMDEEDKYAQVRSSAKMLVEKAFMYPLVAVMVSEAWMVMMKVADLEREQKVLKEGVSAQPDKSECFVVGLLTYDHRICGAVLPFEHRPDGSLRIIEDDVMQDKEVRKAASLDEVRQQVYLPYLFLSTAYEAGRGDKVQ